MFDGQVVLCIVVSNQSTLEPSAEPTNLSFRTKRLIAVQLTEARYDTAMRLRSGNAFLDKYRHRSMLHRVVCRVRDDLGQLGLDPGLD